jgi:hypothetical protein
MNNFISAIIIYSVTFIYFLLSNKTIYICTLKYYSLSEYIYDDKNTLKILVNYLLTYRTIIRYIRIHLIFSSILITISLIIEMPLITSIIKLSVIFVMIISAYDVLSFKARLKALEDRLYKTYYRIDK